LALITLSILSFLLSCTPEPIQKNEQRHIDPAALSSLMKGGKAAVVDTTSDLECMDHRIPGSRCLALEEFDAKSALALPDKKRPTVFYCESNECPRAGRAYEKAKSIGYTDIYVLEGGLAAWKRTGYEVETVERVKRAPVVSIKPEKLGALLKEKKGLFILDIRSEDAYNAGHIDGAVNIPLYMLHRRLKEIPRNVPVIVIDENGKRSFLVCCYLVNNGVKDVTRLFGGMESMSPRKAGKG